MALLTSGYISLGGNVAGRSVAKELNDGAPNFTSTISLNDGNVRSLAQRTGSVSISMSHLRGKSNALDTQTVTVGYYLFQFYGSSIQFYGYYLSGAYGSISDGTANWKSNVAYSNLYWMSTNNTIVLGLQGSRSNSGFTTMNIAGTNYSRTSASFSSSSSVTYWQWANQSNSFGTTTGATKTVTFT